MNETVTENIMNVAETASENTAEAVETVTETVANDGMDELANHVVELMTRVYRRGALTCVVGGAAGAVAGTLIVKYVVPKVTAAIGKAKEAIAEKKHARDEKVDSKIRLN